MSRSVSAADRWVAITPHNSNRIASGPPSAIVVGVTGTVTMVDEAGTEMQRTLTAEQIYPYMPVVIKATGTAATGIFGLYNR